MQHVSKTLLVTTYQPEVTKAKYIQSTDNVLYHMHRKRQERNAVAANEEKSTVKVRSTPYICNSSLSKSFLSVEENKIVKHSEYFVSDAKKPWKTFPISWNASISNIPLSLIICPVEQTKSRDWGVRSLRLMLFWSLDDVAVRNLQVVRPCWRCLSYSWEERSDTLVRTVSILSSSQILLGAVLTIIKMDGLSPRQGGTMRSFSLSHHLAQPFLT